MSRSTIYTHRAEHIAASSPDAVLALVVDGEPEGVAIAERVLARCLGD